MFYGYYFLLAKEIIESFSGATPFSFITKESALTVPAPNPSPQEQSRIATVLSWFDLIKNKRRQNEILEKIAMAIFKSWFINFEPFKDDEFVNSELGAIPNGWEVDFITKVIEFDPGAVLIKGKNYAYVEMRMASTNSMFCSYYFRQFTGSGVRF